MMHNTNRLKKDIYLSPDVPNIFVAAASNDVSSLEIALQYYDVNIQDENGMTPLHHAAGSLAFNAVSRLLQESNLDIFLKDNFGREAAIMAEEILGLCDPLADKMRDMIWPPRDEDSHLDTKDNPDTGNIVPLDPNEPK